MRKGAKAVKIIKPVIVNVSTKDDAGEDVETDCLIGFTPISVFDIGATEPIKGEDSQEWRAEADKAVRNISGDTREILAMLVDYADSINIPVQFGREYMRGRENGFTRDRGVSQEIYIDDTAAIASQTGTLAHELGHALMHHGIMDYKERRGLYELEAESFAYIAMAMLGIESEAFTDRSAKYIAGWIGEDKQTEVREAFTRVSQAVYPMIDAILSASGAVEAVAEVA